jgi:hypothetical protein
LVGPGETIGAPLELAAADHAPLEDEGGRIGLGRRELPPSDADRGVVGGRHRQSSEPAARADRSPFHRVAGYQKKIDDI